MMLIIFVIHFLILTQANKVHLKLNEKGPNICLYFYTVKKDQEIELRIEVNQFNARVKYVELIVGSRSTLTFFNIFLVLNKH